MDLLGYAVAMLFAVICIGLALACGGYHERSRRDKEVTLQWMGIAKGAVDDVERLKAENQELRQVIRDSGEGWRIGEPI